MHCRLVSLDSEHIGRPENISTLFWRLAHQLNRTGKWIDGCRIPIDEHLGNADLNRTRFERKRSEGSCHLQWYGNVRSDGVDDFSPILIECIRDIPCGENIR